MARQPTEINIPPRVRKGLEDAGLKVPGKEFRKAESEDPERAALKLAQDGGEMTPATAAKIVKLLTQAKKI